MVITVICAVLLFAIVLSITVRFTLASNHNEPIPSSSTQTTEATGTCTMAGWGWSTFSQLSFINFVLDALGNGWNSSADLVYSYTSALTATSKMFYRMMSVRRQYYEALQINVSATGNYTFGSVSSMDTYGYLLTNEWNPQMLCKNLLQENDDVMTDVVQFQIQAQLEAGSTYILLVTTYRSNTTGGFTIRIFGPANVSVLAIDDVQPSLGEWVGLLNHLSSGQIFKEDASERRSRSSFFSRYATHSS